MADSCRDNISSFSLLGLREVIPDQTGVEQWKELMLNTGELTAISNFPKGLQLLTSIMF
jgi:hypothetical protein